MAQDPFAVSSEDDAFVAPKSPIRVYAIDDDPSVLSFFEVLCRESADLHLVGTRQSAEDAIPDVYRKKPDVIVVDLRMGPMGGLECTRHLRQLVPDSKILIFTAHTDKHNVLEAVKAGASGFLVKPAMMNELARSIRKVQFGQPVMADLALNFLMTTLQQATRQTMSKLLSMKESHVMGLLILGKSDKDISNELEISFTTVRTYIERICEKLQVHGRKEAVAEYLSRRI